MPKSRSPFGAPKTVGMPQARRRGIGSAPEPVKRDLFNRARALADDVNRLAPECACGSFFCPWDKLRKQLARVAAQRDAPRRLDALAKSGKPLPRALAATLHYSATEKVPGLAPFKLGGRTYFWIPRMPISKEAMCGLQNHHVPELRLLALSRVSGRGRYTVYAWEGHTVARRLGEAVPKGFVDSLAKGTKYSLARDEDGWSCPHVAESAHLAVEHRDFSVRVCVRCAREDENLAVHIGNRILPPPKTRPLRYTFDPSLKCTAKECTVEPSWEVNPLKQAEYASGALSDRWISVKEVVRLTDKITARGVYTLPGKCFEDDVEAYVAALEGSDGERGALKAILKARKGGLQLDEPSAARALERVWSDHAKTGLAAVAGEVIADRLLADMPKASPAQLVAAAEAEKRSGELLKALPRFKDLPPLARFADRVARRHRVGDGAGALRLLEEGKDHRGKAVRWAFLLALNAAKGADWQFSREERELGEFLRGPVAGLLAAEGDAYREGLQQVLTLSGSGETLPP